MMGREEVVPGLFCVGSAFAGFGRWNRLFVAWLEPQGEKHCDTQLMYPRLGGARVDCRFAARLRNPFFARSPTLTSSQGEHQDSVVGMRASDLHQTGP